MIWSAQHGAAGDVYRTRRFMHMLNFEEALKKFRPSLEVVEAEDQIYKNDLKDAADLVEDIIREMNRMAPSSKKQADV